jgi:hypothetical protein
MVPCPHVAVHVAPEVVAQAPTQSIFGMHACSLQLIVCVAGQAVPPHEGFVEAIKDRDDTPPPHDVEHAPHSDHDPAQSTAQHCVLHAMDSGEEGHAFPPHAAAVETAKVRDCVPPPHDAEHAPYPDQDPSQLVGVLPVQPIFRVSPSLYKHAAPLPICVKEIEYV